MQNKNNKDKIKNPKKILTILLLIIGVIFVILLAIIIIRLIGNPKSTYTAKQISDNHSSSPSTSSILNPSSVPSITDSSSTISDSSDNSNIEKSSRPATPNKNKSASKSNNQIHYYNSSTIIASQPDNNLTQSQDTTSNPPIIPSSEPDTIIQSSSSEPDIIIQPSSSAPSDIVTKVNINTATVEELEQGLPLEYLMCKAIVEYRDQNGPFASVDDLILVDGIGKNLLEKIKPYCVV